MDKSAAKAAQTLHTPTLGRRQILTGMAALGLLTPLNPVIAKAATRQEEAQELVERARITASAMLKDPKFEELRGVIERARGILIFPQVLKGGFILGGQGGTGVIMARGSDDSWSAPAFMTLAAGSVGLQIGGQVSEVILTIMNDGALNAILTDNFKFGGAISIAVGPVGKGVEASTTANLNEDVYAFSNSVGLFGGGSFEGAALLDRNDLNNAFYSTSDSTIEEIILARKYYNPKVDPLRKSLP